MTHKIINSKANIGMLENITHHSHSSPQKNIVQGKSINVNKLQNVKHAKLGLTDHSPETLTILLEPYLSSIIFTHINKDAVAIEWPQTYKIDVPNDLDTSMCISAKSKLVCNTELYAIIAFKSFWDISLKTTSTQQNIVTRMQRFTDISVDNTNWTLIKQK